MKVELKETKFKKRWIAALGLCVLLGYAGYAVSSKAIPSLPESDVVFQTVQTGPLDIYATVFGELASAQEQLLTAPALGKVASIQLRPGARVDPDSIILVLSNPKLEQEVNESRGELAQLKAEFEAFKYEQVNARLNYESSIADIDAELEKATLELSVNQELLDLGVASKLALRRADLAVKQQTKRLAFEKKKFEQFLEMQGHQRTQREITMTQQAAKVKILEQQLADMSVKAGISGTLQTLDVELGESVNLGQAVAKVGSDTTLIARLRIPQYQADQIDLNAATSINTSKGEIAAQISRIESVVTDNAVLAEATLSGELTSNARPSLGISAKIFVKHTANAVYINQSPGLRPRSKTSVFVQTQEHIIEKRQITLGDLSLNKLIVTEGLKAGEQLVVSQLDHLAHVEQIKLTQ